MPYVSEAVPSCGDVTCVVCSPAAGANVLEDFQAVMAQIERDRQRRERAAIRQRREAARMNEDYNDEVPATEVPECDCKICQHKRRHTYLPSSVIRQYSYKPRSAFKKTANDRFGYYLGVELETQQNDWRVDGEVAAAMRLPARFWYPKHDGSVSGPEFVSHPATLDWWRSKKRYLSTMFENLLHAGYSSHNGGACGMHINVSKNAFETQEHLTRFLHLLHFSPKWALTMSRRTLNQASQWAKLNIDTTDKQKVAAQRVFLAGDHGYGKYTAFGTPYDGQRFEFRLPRGTLRVDRFYKNLEWTVGMIEYTRSISRLVDATPKKFMKWVIENQQEYPYLEGFINEKFGVKNATA